MSEEILEEDDTLDIEEIKNLLANRQFATLKERLSHTNEADIADLFEECTEAEIPVLYRLLGKEEAAEVFSRMEPEYQEMLVNALTDRELKQVLDELFLDDAVDLVEEMPANIVKRILKNTDSQTRNSIKELLKYPEDSAGSMMTVEYVNIKKNMTVKDAINRIRGMAPDSETIYTVYVTENRELLGIVTLKDLLIARDDIMIEDIMETDIITVQTLEDQEDVAMKFKKYGFLAFPVVDQEDRLVGIVTVDDAIDVLEEETTEDISKMAAIVPQEKPYLRQTTYELWKSRIPWLLLLMVSATFTGMIITSFEEALAKYVILTAYIPMLMDTGGNSGSQASVTVIRGISLDEIEFRDIFRVIWKEVRVATLCGLTLAVCNFAKLVMFDRLTMIVALTICLTLVVTIFCAKLVGCTLPLIAFRLGFDPAVMASPFITTIVDAISLLVYFQFATRLLGI